MGSEAMSGGTSPNSVIPAKAGIPLLPPTGKWDAGGASSWEIRR